MPYMQDDVMMSQLLKTEVDLLRIYDDDDDDNNFERNKISKTQSKLVNSLLLTRQVVLTTFITSSIITINNNNNHHQSSMMMLMMRLNSLNSCSIRKKRFFHAILFGNGKRILSFFLSFHPFLISYRY